MNIFEIVRDGVSSEAAARYYGLTFGRNGRARCPWHNDHKPDLAFYDNGYCFCHACHCGGDAVDLVAQMFGLTPLKAAEKVVDDFNLLHPTEGYKHVSQKDVELRNAENAVINAKHELYKIDGELTEERDKAATWLQFKKMELKMLREGKPIKEEPRERSEFDKRWIKLCDIVHKCEALLAAYSPDAIGDGFDKVVECMARANDELDYMWNMSEIDRSGNNV